MSPRLHLSVPRGAAPGERRFGITGLTKPELVLLDAAVLIALEQMRRDATTVDELGHKRAAAALWEQKADLERIYRVIRDAQQITP